MITKGQINFFARQFKTNESTVFREYLQVFFLHKLYQYEKSRRVFFKGGTAIHFLLGAPRFSEDLDFTVNMGEKEFFLFINNIFKEIIKEEKVAFKERKTITGKRFLLTASPGVLPYATFINLDFSFREKVFQPDKSIFESSYPIIFTSFIYHLSMEEICAEKIRALLTRQKGRDLFDLWFLISKGTVINGALFKKKLAYYEITDDKWPDLKQKIEKFSEKQFITDLRPFVPADKRDKLSEQYAYIKTYLLEKLTGFIVKLGSSPPKKF